MEFCGLRYDCNEDCFTYSFIFKVKLSLIDLYNQVTLEALEQNKFELSINNCRKIIKMGCASLFTTKIFEILCNPRFFINVERKQDFYNFKNPEDKILPKNEIERIDFMIETSNYIKGFYDDNVKFTIEYTETIKKFLDKKEMLDSLTLLAIFKKGY